MTIICDPHTQRYPLKVNMVTYVILSYVYRICVYIIVLTTLPQNCF